MCPDCENHAKDAADAATLRHAFYNAVAAFNAVKTKVGFPEPYIEVWRMFYNAIIDSGAGIAMLAELKRLRERVSELESARSSNTEESK